MAQVPEGLPRTLAPEFHYVDVAAGLKLAAEGKAAHVVHVTSSRTVRRPSHSWEIAISRMHFQVWGGATSPFPNCETVVSQLGDRDLPHAFSKFGVVPRHIFPNCEATASQLGDGTAEADAASAGRAPALCSQIPTLAKRPPHLFSQL